MHLSSHYLAIVHNSKLIGALFLLSLCFTEVYSQGNELVPNQDFTNFIQCPIGPGEIKFAVGWFSPNERTTDYIHNCADGYLTSIPQNRWGFEFPAKGFGYAGIRTFLGRVRASTDSIPDRDYREYLAAKLNLPLEAGKTYFLSFKVSVAEQAKYTSDDLGMAFMSEIPDWQLVYDQFTPALANQQGRYITQTEGWMTIFGSYRANGTEKYVIIGNFKNDQGTSLIVSNDFDDDAESTTYFYIDDVSVKPCTADFPEHIIQTQDTSLCPGESITLEATPVEDAIYIWENGDRGDKRVVSQADTFMVEMILKGCSLSDTVIVAPKIAAPLNLGADTVLCPGETLVLSADSSLISYQWNTGDNSADIEIRESGTYSLEVYNGECITTDAINVQYDLPFDLNFALDTTHCAGTPITLSPSVAGKSYTWNDSSKQSSYTTSLSGDYSVNIQSLCFEGMEYFTVRDVDCGCDGLFPNVFTPNGDGINDSFVPELTDGISDYHLEVFDRWGKQLFSTDVQGKAWNGAINNHQLPPGIYYWSIEYGCLENGLPSKRSKNGYVQLLR